MTSFASQMAGRPYAAGKCKTHPEIESDGTCSRCGDFACWECWVDEIGSCRACVEREARRGRRILLACSAGALFLTTLNVAWQTYQGMFRSALVGRMLLYVLVCWQMYRGRRWARKAFVALMLVGTVKFAQQVFLDAFQIVYAAVYAGLGATILVSRSVRACFAR